MIGLGRERGEVAINPSCCLKEEVALSFCDELLGLRFSAIDEEGVAAVILSVLDVRCTSFLVTPADIPFSTLSYQCLHTSKVASDRFEMIDKYGGMNELFVVCLDI